MNALALQKTNGKSNIIFFRIESSPIHEALLNMGMMPNLNGFIYVSYALELIREDPDSLHHITKGLYIDIAKNFHTKPTSVERAIRHAITMTWLRGNRPYINHVFHDFIDPDKCIPSNTVFLAGLHNHLKTLHYE